MRAIMTVGVAGSGKSTLAEGLHDNFMEINLDYCREAVNGSPDDNSNIMKVLAYRDNLIDLAAIEGADIIISDTNLNKDFRDELLNKLKRLGYEVTLVHIATPLDQALEFNQKRDRQVPDEVIRGMHYTLQDQLAKGELQHPAVVRTITHDPTRDGKLAL